MRHNLLLVIALSALCVSPAVAISRWFTSSFEDLRFSLKRYGHCYGDLPAIVDEKHNETEYLIHQMRTFLEAANYDNEQLASVSVLMDTICQPHIRAQTGTYGVSQGINLTEYNSKQVRCNSIDDSLDAMYPVLKRAALNHSEPLNFSSIEFHSANRNQSSATYNISDLINTSWIQSETPLEQACYITDAVKEFVQARQSKAPAQDRSQSPSTFSGLFDLLDRVLERLYGLQRRLYWEGSNRVEQMSARLSNGVKAVRGRISGMIGSITNRTPTVATNATATTATNATSAGGNALGRLVNGTSAFVGAATNALRPPYGRPSAAETTATASQTVGGRFGPPMGSPSTANTVLSL